MKFEISVDLTNAAYYIGSGGTAGMPTPKFSFVMCLDPTWTRIECLGKLYEYFYDAMITTYEFNDELVERADSVCRAFEYVAKAIGGLDPEKPVQYTCDWPVHDTGIVVYIKVNEL